MTTNEPINCPFCGDGEAILTLVPLSFSTSSTTYHTTTVCHKCSNCGEEFDTSESANITWDVIKSLTQDRVVKFL